jgi:hypothetical protein
MMINISEFGTEPGRMVEASSTSLELELTTDNSDSWCWIPESQRQRELEDEYILGDIIGR